MLNGEIRRLRKLSPGLRPFVFPQVLGITREYVRKRVRVKGGAVPQEIELKRYMDTIVSRLCDVIQPDEQAGETSILPRIEPYRPVGSMSEVLFRKLKQAHGTVKSHMSHIVVDSGWEHSMGLGNMRWAFFLKGCANVF